VNAGGTHATSGDSTCHFDDGPGVCCIPPQEQQTGDGCTARGGLCAPIGGCNLVDGAFAPATDCVGVPIICCVPEKTCGLENDVCCTPGPSADFRPQCDRGTFTCSAFPDTVLTPTDQCL
jgi:hypothetical protein